MKIHWQSVIVIILVSVLIQLLFKLDFTEDGEQQEYCDMVEIHRLDRRVGWPDYRGNYDEVCK